MAISKIIHILGTGGANSATTSGVDTTGATLLVVAVSIYTGGSATTVSDSKSNTWTKLTSYSATTNSRITIYYSVNPTVGSAHTFTADGTSNYPGILMTAFDGVVDASPFDLENGFGRTTSGSTVQTGSITPSEDNELIITALANDTTVATATADEGMTLIQWLNWQSATNMGVGMSYKVQTTATAINPTWTGSANSNFATAIACFKSAPNSGPVSLGLMGVGK